MLYEWVPSACFRGSVRKNAAEKAERLHPCVKLRVQPLGGSAPARAFNLYGNGRAGNYQAVPSVTSKVCGAPPSRTKVTLTVLPGA